MEERTESPGRMSYALEQSIHNTKHNRMDAHLALETFYQRKFQDNLDSILLITTLEAVLSNQDRTIDQLGADETITLKLADRSNLQICIEENKYKFSEDLFRVSNYNPVPQCLGTAFFVNEKTAATAAHVLMDVDTTLLVQGFYAKTNGLITIKKENLYRVSKIYNDIAGYSDENPETREDWKFFEVEPYVQGQRNANFVKPAAEPVTCGKDLYCLGHGLGLPIILSWNGWVHKSIRNHNSFYCKLETYPGNSGSPVFDMETHEIVGILAGQEAMDPKPADDGAITYKLFMAGDYGARCSHYYRLLDRMKTLKPILEKI